MSFKANDRDGGNFTPIDALDPGTYPARIVQLVTMGVQPGTSYQGVQKPDRERLYITYELSHEFLNGEDGEPDPTKPRWISEDFPFYNLEADRAKSTLRYNALDPRGEFGGDWLALVGAACNITLTKEPRKNKKGDTNYVSSVSGATVVPGYEQPTLVNKPRTFDLDEPDMDIFKELPTWLQEKLKTNLNFNGSALQAALGDTPVQEAPTPSSAPAPAMATPPIPPAPPAPNGGTS